MSQTVTVEVNTGKGAQAPLGINTEFAPITSPQRPRSPRLMPLCGRIAVEQKKKIVLEKQVRARRFRQFLALRQRQAIYEAGLADQFKSLCSCGAFPVPAWSRNKKTGEPYFTGAPGSVQLTWRGGHGGEDGPQLVHSWVKKCASPLLCFVDAPKIRWFRSQELQEICGKMHKAGYCWQFWTFTAPHDLTADPQEQVHLFQEAMREFKRNFDRVKEKWRIFGYIRAVEMTDDVPGPGRKSGCHFHHHFVVFFDRKGFTEEEAREMQVFLSRRWVNALIKLGLCPVEKEKSALKWAFRLDVPRQPKDEDADLTYVSEYIIKGASIEMTPGINAKVGRKSKRITHWDLMRLAFTSHPELKPRALAVMLALKGRDWLRFSNGLRAFCGLNEITDEEILKEDLSTFVAEFDDEIWRGVDRVKGQFVLQESIIEEVQDQGIDLSALPVDPEKMTQLDFSSREVQTIQDIAENFASMIAFTGCDPLTGEDLTVWNDP